MKKFLSLVLALAMTMSLVTVSAGAKDFTDADKITYVEAVEVMTAIGVVDGDTAGNFNPTAGLTRGAAAKIICNLILGPTTATALNADAAPYVDVPADSTFAGYIAYCKQQGIISGYADGTFKPAAPLTGYAFMKMLLGALGYDGSVEGYTGSNWSIAVAKQALYVGLDDGLVTDFNGSAYVTREEAMLYAFNMLQATMVEYDSKTNISVGGAEVVIAGSKADYVDQTGYTDTMGDDDTLQFAEKYFKDLKKDDTASDAFYRPSTTWKLKKVEIGTYTDTPDLTYTTSVDLGDIYKDLGLSDKMEFVTSVPTAGTTADEDWYVVYEDGVLESTSAAYADITKGDDDNSIGANGVLTEVYYDDDDNSAIVVLVNTFIGQVTTVEEATAKADAYIEVSDEYSGTFTFASDGLEFETEAFEEDDWVLFTYSWKTGEDCIEAVALAESVTGEVSKYTTNKSVVIDGTKYEYAYLVTTQAASATLEVDVVAYVDGYGYVIFVDADDAVVTDYAYVLEAGADEARGGSDKWAKLLYTDGTIEIVTTNKIYGTSGNAQTHGDPIAAADGKDMEGKFVSYKTNNSGKVVLTEASSTYAINGTNASVAATTAGYVIENGVSKTSATITVSGNAKNINGNSKTVYLLYSLADDEADAYVGMKNVPDVKLASGTTTVAALSKTNEAAKIVVVFTDGAAVKNAGSDVLFIVGNTDAEPTEDTDDTYYVFDAVLNGQITEIKLDAADDSIANLTGGYNVITDDYTVDGDIYTLGTTSSDIIFNITGITKISGDVMSITTSTGTTAYTVADDVVVYKLTSSGKLSVASTNYVRTETVGSGTTDYYGGVAVVLNDDDEIQTIFVELN